MNERGRILRDKAGERVRRYINREINAEEAEKAAKELWKHLWKRWVSDGKRRIYGEDFKGKRGPRSGGAR